MPYPTGGMTAEEFEAELQSRFGYTPKRKTPAALDDPLDALTDKRTVAELLPDYFAAQVEDRPWRKWHPLLRPVLSDRLSLADIETRSGMSRSDFGYAMRDALAVLLDQKWISVASDFDKISRVQPLNDFRATTFSAFETGEPKEVAEGDDLPRVSGAVREFSRQGKLRQFGAKFQFSRQIFLTFGEELSQQILDYANVFSQTQWRVVAETLEAATITTSTDSALGVAGWQKAASAMRNQLNAAGGKCNLPIAVIVVPEDLESTALVLREGLGKAFEILVNPHLTSATTWYAFCSPELSAPLLRLRLRGNDAPKLYSNFSDLLKVEFALSHDFDFIASANTPGLVKAVA